MEKNINNVLSNIASLSNSADTLARQFILNNKPDHKVLMKKIEETNFGFQFATTCTDFTVSFIIDNGNADQKLAEGAKRFATAILPLNDAEFAFSLELLKAKLALYAPEFTQKYKDGIELSAVVRQTIAQSINNNDEPKCNASKRDILIRIMTDYDKIQERMSPKK